MNNITLQEIYYVICIINILCNATQEIYYVIYIIIILCYIAYAIGFENGKNAEE